MNLEVPVRPHDIHICTLDESEQVLYDSDKLVSQVTSYKFLINRLRIRTLNQYSDMHIKDFNFNRLASQVSFNSNRSSLMPLKL